MKCKVLSLSLYVHRTGFVPHSNVRTLKVAHEGARSVPDPESLLASPHSSHLEESEGG